MSAVTASDERFAEVGRGVTLCYQTFGDPSDRPLLLVAGLGTQLLAWNAELCEKLAARGLYVVRFDNRDIGRSSMLREVPVPSVPQLFAARFDKSQYTLSDMARDAVGLLQALDLTPAHVCGISMGGMIGQTMAAQYPQHVRSLTSMLSSTGNRRYGMPHPTTIRRMAKPPAIERDDFVESAVAFFEHIGSHGFPYDPETIGELAGNSYDRGHDPAGGGRQLAAIIKSGNRTKEVSRITAPTLVIHGDRDRMVHPSGGRATAAAIKGSEFVSIPGLGHDLPPALYDRFTELIGDHVDRVQPASLTQEAAA